MRVIPRVRRRHALTSVRAIKLCWTQSRRDRLWCSSPLMSGNESSLPLRREPCANSSFNSPSRLSFGRLPWNWPVGRCNAGSASAGGKNCSSSGRRRRNSPKPRGRMRPFPTGQPPATCRGCPAGRGNSTATRRRARSVCSPGKPPAADRPGPAAARWRSRQRTPDPVSAACRSDSSSETAIKNRSSCVRPRTVEISPTQLDQTQLPVLPVQERIRKA